MPLAMASWKSNGQRAEVDGERIQAEGHRENKGLGLGVLGRGGSMTRSFKFFLARNVYFDLDCLILG